MTASLAELTPVQAANAIRKALRTSRASLRDAAEELNISTKSLYRWIEFLDLRADLESIRVRYAKDIEARRSELGKRGGRPRIYSEAEAAERRRRAVRKSKAKKRKESTHGTVARGRARSAK